MDQQFITAETLTSLGINLPDAEMTALLTHLNDTLEERVGMEITETLNDEQLKVLIDLQESGNEDEVGKWLERNVPDLQEIVQEEIDILLGEVAENRDGIIKK